VRHSRGVPDDGQQRGPTGGDREEFSTRRGPSVPYNARFMSAFTREGTELGCDGVRLASIAAEVGTPVYVYSAATIRDRVQRIRAAFGAHQHAIHYALKANSNLGVVRAVRAAGALVDANSGGEIDVALRAGFTPKDVVFTGVGKTPAEIEKAVALGVKAINAESRGELQRISVVARRQGTTARVALRVNPNISSNSHPHISTGLSVHKFGVPIDDARSMILDAACEELRFVGLHVHVGSQMLGLDPIREAAEALVRLANLLRRDGVVLEHLDLGGGLGIAYRDEELEQVPAFDRYAMTLLDAVRPSGLTTIVEPGRAIVGPAGALVASVVDVKPRPGGTWFVVLDAGMSELMRPALYGAHHRIELVSTDTREPVLCDIVGPICETSDVFGVERPLPKPDLGALVAVLDTGAYGAAMASNYNRHPLPAETLVDGGRWRVVRRRQTIEDQLVGED